MANVNRIDFGCKVTITSDNMTENKGWVWLFNARKSHYFGEDGRSFCGNWMIFTVPDDADDKHDHPENCKACLKKLKRVLAKG